MTLNSSLFKLNEFTIQRSGDEQQIKLDISNFILSIDYYEDILSPNITMNLLLTGSESLISFLPLRGGEQVNCKLISYDGDELSFTNERSLYVYKLAEREMDTNKNLFHLNLISREAITNETTRCVKQYKKKISDTVLEILKSNLKVPDTKLSANSIENTANEYIFTGNMKTPFNIIYWLCAKSIPISQPNINTEPNARSGPMQMAKGVSGFLFYENKDGFNFRSVDSLVSSTNPGTADQTIIPEYFYSQVIETNKINEKFRITGHNFIKNFDLINNLRRGVYSNVTYFYNVQSHKLFVYQYNLKDELSKANTLGGSSNMVLPEGLDKSISRIYFRTSDVGYVGNDNEQRDIADTAKSISRYGILFDQKLNIKIPLNLNLKVGDVIKVVLNSITRGENKQADDKESGRYLISKLRHHIVPNTSITILELIRDTYGLYSPRNNI